MIGNNLKKIGLFLNSKKLLDLASCSVSIFIYIHVSKRKKVPEIERTFNLDQQMERKNIGSTDIAVSNKLAKREERRTASHDTLQAFISSISTALGKHF